MLLKLAWRNIFRNKKRSLITISSVTFAVICAVFMRSLQFGAYDNMIDNVVGSYMGYIQIHKKGFYEEKSIDLAYYTSEIDQIENSNDIDLIAHRIEGFALASFGNQAVPAAVLGLNPNIEKQLIALDTKVESGKYISNSNQGLMLGKGLAKLMDIKIGDTLSLIGQGYHGSIAAGNYPVYAILDLKTPELNKRTLIMNFSLAQDFFAMQDVATTAVLGLKDNDWKKVQKDISAQLDSTEYEVLNWQEMLPEMVQLIRADRAGGTVVLIILYLIIAFGLFGTVLMLQEERSFEYGVLVAIGMQKNKLFMISLIETLIMAFIGVIAGMVLAFPLVFYFHFNPIKLGGEIKEIAERFGFEAVLPTSIDYSIVLSHASIIFLLVLIVNTYSYWKIKRLQTVKAMRQ